MTVVGRPQRMESADMRSYLHRYQALVAALALALPTLARDLPEIRQDGVLRHLGIPYANFVSGAGDGMDVEIIQRFAEQLGVKYEYAKTDWGTALEDLVGRKVTAAGSAVEFGETVPVRGDLIANGFTILPWRQKVVAFSDPTFPSQVWLVARADSKVAPIKPAGDIDQDIAATRRLMEATSVLALEKTCLDPKLYDLKATGAKVILFNGKLNEMAPALLNNEAELTILDVPDALVALGKWPGQIKIIGPISHPQEMAVGFPLEAPQLRAAFNAFLAKIRADGTYDTIVRKYYPTAAYYFPAFFKKP
jgi:ABC-type amino acid transport substrate-binding protein